MIEAARQKAMESIRYWMYETPISSKKIETVGEYGFAVLLSEEEAALLYETLNWVDDQSDDELYICGTDCPDIGEFGGIQLITVSDGEYGLEDGIWLVVNYNEL